MKLGLHCLDAKTGKQLRARDLVADYKTIIPPRYMRAPTGDMPPYTAKVMADQDVADVYAFLQALAPPPSLSSLPLLQP